jgi:hypothetical protein
VCAKHLAGSRVVALQKHGLRSYLGSWRVQMFMRYLTDARMELVEEQSGGGEPDPAGEFSKVSRPYS